MFSKFKNVMKESETYQKKKQEVKLRYNKINKSNDNNNHKINWNVKRRLQELGIQSHVHPLVFNIIAPCLSLSLPNEH